MIPTLLGITLVVFMVMAASPGGISAQSLIEGQNLEPQTKQALEDYYNKLYGLDDPAPLQYLRWLNNISPIGVVFDSDGNFDHFSLNKGSDLGRSFRYGRPVGELVAERVPITMLLNVLSIPLIYIIAIVVGVRAAIQRGSRFDVGTNITMLGLWSVPIMLAGVLMIGFFSSKQYWHWFPTAGLSERAALDMAFLPHWSDLYDVLMLFGCTIAATGLMGFVARSSTISFRFMMVLLPSVFFAWRMTSALPGEFVTGVFILLSTLFSMLAWLVALSESTKFRVASFLTLGAFCGVCIGMHFSNGEFIRGFLLDRIWHLILPIICLSYGSFAFLSRLTRSAVLENLLADYARTARAKGVNEASILWHHVFRNSLLPLITVSASLLPGLLAGSVIVESIFSIDGMGKLAVEAVQGRDRELVLSITLISGVLTLIGYLIADIAYSLADPRVSYE